MDAGAAAEEWFPSLHDLLLDGNADIAIIKLVQTRKLKTNAGAISFMQFSTVQWTKKHQMNAIIFEFSDKYILISFLI